VLTAKHRRYKPCTLNPAFAFILLTCQLANFIGLNLKNSLIILSILTFSTVTFAQTLPNKTQPPPKSPEAVVQEYFSLLQKKQWLGITDLFSPSALTKFKTSLLPVVQLDMVKGKGELCNVFFGKKLTAGELQTMSEKDFFFFAMSGIVMQIADFGLRFDRIEVLGKVPEGDSLAHVVSRIYIGKGENQVQNIDVTSLEKVKGEWKLLMKSDMERFIQDLKNQVLENTKKQ